MNVRELQVLVGREADVDAIVSKYPNKRSATIPLLFLVQSVEGHVTEQGMRDVAQVLGLTPAEVLSVASFYTMLKKKPTGEYLISVCRNISCTHMGGRKVLKAVEDRLGIGAGETTTDGRFTIEAAECLATCDGAPSMQINYEDFYNVTPDEVVSLIDRLESGQDVTSVAGEKVVTHKEISREVAMTGTLDKARAAVGETARTVSGEVPPADMAPGFRPPVEGHGAGKDGDA
ncbi:MAG: NADH-quinone oxidoreductase subunit NuoE [Actinomycetota bacterium]